MLLMLNMILCMNNYVMSASGVWIGHVFKSTELDCTYFIQMIGILVLITVLNTAGEWII